MDRQPCGTRTAYRQHLANREVPDDACLAANRAYTTASRQRATRNRETAGWASQEQARMLRQLIHLIAGMYRDEGLLP